MNRERITDGCDSAPRAFMLVAASQTVQRFSLTLACCRRTGEGFERQRNRHNHHEVRRCPNRALELPAGCW